MLSFKRLFGDENKKALKRLEPIVERINALESDIEVLSDEKLAEKTENLKRRLHKGETLDDLLPESFATVREAAKRTLGQRHFAVCQGCLFFQSPRDGLLLWRCS